MFWPDRMCWRLALVTLQSGQISSASNHWWRFLGQGRVFIKWRNVKKFKEYRNFGNALCIYTVWPKGHHPKKKGYTLYISLYSIFHRTPLALFTACILCGIFLISFCNITQFISIQDLFSQRSCIDESLTAAQSLSPAYPKDSECG